MATTATRGKRGGRGGHDSFGPNSRRGSWRGNSNGPLPSFNNNTPRAPPPSVGNAFPTPAQATYAPTAEEQAKRAMHDRVLFLIMNLIGTKVSVTTRLGQRHEGILSSAHTDGELSVVLKAARLVSGGDSAAEGSTPAPLRPTLIVPAKDLDELEAVGVDLDSDERDTFRTDTEISGTPRPLQERELQPWQPSPPPLLNDPAILSSSADPISWADDDPMAAPVGGLEGKIGGWDQFRANEQLFGIGTDFDEELYTTKLDRSGKDYKEREKRADRLAREIMGTASSNPHILEERGQVDDSGMGEEDKYGAVVRGPNAYVPPGARRSSDQAGSPAAPPSRPNGPSPTSSATSAPASSATSASSAPAPAPAPAMAPSRSSASNAAPAAPAMAVTSSQDKSTPAVPKPANGDPPVLGDFRAFVNTEKERLKQRKSALAKKEKNTTVADLIKFGQNFKLKTAMPEDIASIVAKDEAKQKEMIAKTAAAAAAAAAATTSASTSASAFTSKSPPAVQSPASTSTSPLATKSSLAPGQGQQGPSHPPRFTAAAAAVGAKPFMQIAKIPPFNPEKARAAREAKERAEKEKKEGAGAGADAASPALSQASVATGMGSGFKLNAKAAAFSFKPNPNASSFTPGAGGASPQAKPASAQQPAPPPNPFFGTRPLKKGSSSLHVKEDFNPFKHSNVPEAHLVGPGWQFSGRPYKHHFPPHPSHPPPAAFPPHHQPDFASPDDPAAHAAVQAAAAQAQAVAAAAQQGQYFYRYPFPPGQGPPHMHAGAPPMPPYGMAPPPQFMPGPPPGPHGQMAFAPGPPPPQMQHGQGGPPPQFIPAMGGMPPPGQQFMPPTPFSPNMQPGGGRPPMPPPGPPGPPVTQQPGMPPHMFAPAYPSPSPQMAHVLPYPPPPPQMRPPPTMAPPAAATPVPAPAPAGADGTAPPYAAGAGADGGGPGM